MYNINVDYEVSNINVNYEVLNININVCVFILCSMFYGKEKNECKIYDIKMRDKV